MEHLKFLLDHNILPCLPFFMSVSSKTQVNVSRIIEAIIIAILAGSLSAYMTLQNIELRMMMIEEKVDKIYTDIYKPHIGGNYENSME